MVEVNTHPKPHIAAVIVEPGDERAPKMAVAKLKAVRGAGWLAVLTYAKGNTLATDGGVGPMVESVALRASRGERRAWATWESRQRPLCMCGKGLLPTAGGVFRKHSGSDGQECPGSGQGPSEAVSAVADWAFAVAYVADTVEGWNVTGATRMNATEFAGWLKS